ncbi:four-carbon acid sugar kinase family protein [Cyanobium sp. Alchichica 3B3-8F6]|uniref:four-carbon acid sugar kinase family protein n=1 Tax=Cyanobium sp. Alchichica 3B3-8F6 TaxID=2823696 RepID=UPI0020CCBC95|nr:four-carbon acid sugar kinase family protein [Cyanobium sp. Alchichica 3B3-8F6]MCP9881741.1 four-carbon acid sugar kinase family protein [Cyanobium sp. Alchichica 3B3-8F6]
MAAPTKIIVIDDDPTGSQTVHSCPLLLRWDPATLAAGLRHPSPLLFLLANTRGLAPQPAADRVREICRALAVALPAAGIAHWWLVSRGDSTLRGHFPLEVDVIAAELGPFAATLLIPAFLDGGRTTVGGVHLLNGQPVHETPFARDGLFGYGSSDLPAWVEEKSGGRIPAADVLRLEGAELDRAAQDGGHDLAQWLDGLENQPVVAVDGERPGQLAALAGAVRAASRAVLSQSAASWIQALAALPPQPRDAAGLAGLRRRDRDGAPLPGLVLVGSHVPLADAQLAALLVEPVCGLVELDVAKVQRVLEGPAPAELLASLERSWLAQLQAVLAAGQTPVLATSRGELVCASPQERRRLGEALAGLMARLAAALAPRLGYVISKGGITSHTLLADGLALAAVELQGQLLPGLSLVLTPADGPVPGQPVLTFPGNLGEADTLRQAWCWMEGQGSTSCLGDAD